MFDKITEIIKEKDVGKRLDKFLAEILKNYSRASIQKKIKLGEILVNNKKVVPHYFLKIDDTVSLEEIKKQVEKTIKRAKAEIKGVSSEVLAKGEGVRKAKKETKKIIKKIKEVANRELPKKLTPNKNIKVEVVFEDKDYLVINKPTGLVVHPGDGHVGQDTLANWLIAYFPKIEKIGSDPLRPGIVHRLDRDASGLMVVAKTNNAYKSLRKQFDEGRVTKEYSVLVSGNIANDEGTIEIPLGRAKKGFKIVKKEGGREAITHYSVVERFKGYTLLDIEIETGRMHQIRAHFKELKHPIVGDVIYGGNTKVLKRLFLHAGRLGFLNLNGEWQEFEIRLDKNLENFLKKIAH